MTEERQIQMLSSRVNHTTQGSIKEFIDTVWEIFVSLSISYSRYHVQLHLNHDTTLLLLPDEIYMTSRIPPVLAVGEIAHTAATIK